jgi:hypothetical protein
MIERRSFNDPKIGPCHAYVGRCGPFRDQLRALTFTWRPLSGAKDRGGPGHRTGGFWIVPVSRVQHNPLLARGMQLLELQANGAALGKSVREVAEAELELRALLRLDKSKLEEATAA